MKTDNGDVFVKTNIAVFALHQLNLRGTALFPRGLAVPFFLENGICKK